MSKSDKALKKLLKKPTAADFTWSELIRILTSLGYKMDSSSGGSSRKFIHNAKNAIFTCHEPHPSNIVKKYCIENLIQHLQEYEFINSDD